MTSTIRTLVAGLAMLGATSAALAQDAPILAKLATADVAAGETAAATCKGCHTFEKDGAQRSGPNLWGIVNQVMGSVDGFAYSDAFKARQEAGETWTYAALDAFLAAPRQSVPGNKMAFNGIPDENRRANLVAYLRTLADEPAPLP